MTLKGEARTRYMRDYMRRRRAKQHAKAPGLTKGRVKPSPAADTAKDTRIRELETELAQARQRIAKLEQRGEGRLTRSHREERGRPVEFTEVGKLRAEIGRLKSDILKLKAALQEEPDAAKLRQKVVDQQVAMAGLRQALKKTAKERDEYRVRVNAYRQPKHQEARRLLTGANYRVIIKALHSDRSKHVTAAELAAAERVATGLRPLFDEEG